MKNCIGVIGAMDDEVKGIIAKLENHKSEFVGGVEFHTGTLHSKDVVVAKCGVGKVFAAMCAQAMIIKYSPRLIVNTGVAGALAPQLNTSDVAIATKLVQHDMDTSAIGDPKGLISGINKIYFDTDERAVEILVATAAEKGVNYLCGTVASGDVFVADADSRSAIKADFSAIACEMEGAAIAQTAYVNDTPFAVIRSISDNADGTSSVAFPQFLKEAVVTSQMLTEALVMNY